METEIMEVGGPSTEQKTWEIIWAATKPYKERPIQKQVYHPF